jgi:GGDEF domain-containing protein
MALSWSMFPYRKPYTDDMDWEPIYDKKVVRKWKMKKLFKSINKGLIESLIIDRYFDIYTRNGFEYVLEEAEEKDCKIFLIDFDDIRGMNKKLGYSKVNDILKNTFSELKEYYTIGRAFSGDEIFFLTYNLSDNIDMIKDICSKNNLTFTYIEKTHRYMIKHTMGKYEITFHKLQDTLEEMINELH